MLGLVNVAQVNTSIMANFPFSAVQGQALFKLALILSAINPRIGGVLISGPRGSAKSTLARGLADVMPGSSGHDFVTLPLGASDEMLLGTLDLQKVLNDQDVSFNPGLLAKAHGGVLYVDEVNLLIDSQVDLLLDVCASGINRIERDGISHSHASEFILLGTMNPDEGELRPQLQDRFGLAVELTGQFDKQQRIDIVRLREAFDTAAETFLASYQQQQSQISQNIERARQTLSTVTVNEQLRGEIAERCAAANVDGLRADIVWLRAASAHAALEGRSAVELSDLEAVEQLVLCHRRKDNADSKQPPSPPSAKSYSRPQPSPSESDTTEDTAADGDWGSMNAQVQATATPSSSINCQVTALKREHSAANKMNCSNKKGRLLGGRKLPAGSLAKGERVNWFSTLAKNAGQWPLKKLFYRPPKTGQQVLHLVLLDTSASTLHGNGFAKAKAAVLDIAQQAYLVREQLAIVGFGNQQADILLPSVRAPKALRPWLDELTAAGGTPLREGLQRARDYQQSTLHKTQGMQLKNYLITDGKTTHSLQGLDLLGETVVIDIEQSEVKRGKAKQLAQQLDAVYWPLPA